MTMKSMTVKRRNIFDVTVGRGVSIEDPVSLNGCEIGDETKIHAFVMIQPGVKIGRRCKVEPGAMIPSGVTIEDEVFIGPLVCFTNDNEPRATNIDGSLKGKDDWSQERTIVKRGASIGAGAVIMPGLALGECSMVGAGSVVTRDVPDYTRVWGVPARVHGKVFDELERKDIRRNPTKRP